MQSKWKLIGIVVLGLLASAPSFGTWGRCGPSIEQKFDEFREEIKSRIGSSISEVPSLQGCNPSRDLTNGLADQLAETILATKESGQHVQMLWMAGVLEKVREAFKGPGHQRDFHRLSTRVFTQVKANFDNLAEPPPLARRAEFGGFNSLIEALNQGPPAPTPPTPPPPDPDPPPDPVPPPPDPVQPPPDPDTTPPDSGWWRYMVGVVIVGLGLALMFFIYQALNQRKGAVIHDGTGMAQFRDESTRPSPSGEFGSGSTEPASADRNSYPLTPDRPQDSTNVSEVMNQLNELKEQIERISSTQEKINAGYQTLKEDHKAAIEGFSEDLERLSTQLMTLQNGNKTIWASQRDLKSGFERLRLAIKGLQATTQELQKVPSPLAAQFETEQALLKKDWKRFLNTEKEIGRLAQSVKAEGDHKVIFDELLRELPKAVESDPQLSQFFGSKLAPIHFINRQLKLILLAGARAEQEMPEENALMSKLLGLRDSAHLLATFRNTDKAGEELLRFKPTEWCNKKLPELADQFLCFYQEAQAKGQSAPLDKALKVVIRALRIGELEPIDIVLGETDFNSEIHVGVSRDNQPKYPEGTIVGVVKNGFKNIRDARVVTQPEVIVNRYEENRHRA